MLDKLPTELLIEVLELAAPLQYDPSFYLERRELVRNLCLVSKRLCSLSQPMLPEVFEVQEQKDVGCLEVEREGKKRGTLVALLVVYGKEVTDEATGQPYNVVDLRGLVELCPNVSNFLLSGEGLFDLGLLNPLKGSSFLSSHQRELTNFPFTYRPSPPGRLPLLRRTRTPSRLSTTSFRHRALPLQSAIQRRLLRQLPLHLDYSLAQSIRIIEVWQRQHHDAVRQSRNSALPWYLRVRLPRRLPSDFLRHR